jgi:hypothetical protein
MGQVSRRALLTRAGIGTGAGVVALLGGAAAPALASAEVDLANARLICSSKRLMVAWYTRWLNTPKALGESPTKDLLLAIRKQEQAHYGLLAPLLGATAPTEDDFTFTLPAGALRNPETAAKFAFDLETMMLGIAIGAAATTQDAGVAASIARIAACDGQHLGAVSVLGSGSAVPTELPRPIGVEDASAQLSQFLSN